MKTDKELADELDAADRLRKRGYTKEKCPTCNGTGHALYGDTPRECFKCGGRGSKWQAPLMQ